MKLPEENIGTRKWLVIKKFYQISFQSLFYSILFFYFEFHFDIFINQLRLFFRFLLNEVH